MATDTLVRDLLVLLGVCFALAGSLVVYDRDFPWKWFEKSEAESMVSAEYPNKAERGAGVAASGSNASIDSASEWWTADRAARKQLRSIFPDPKIVHIDLHRRQR